MKRVTVWVGAGLVGLVVLAAVVSMIWLPADPNAVSSLTLAPPSSSHLLGTDNLGRDLAARLLVGARSCLMVGIVAVGIGALIGVPLGILAGALRGVASGVLMRAADVVYAFPALLLAILLAAARGQASTATAMAAIGVASIPAFMRVTRSAAVEVISQDFIDAARGAGFGPAHIAVRHLWPNVLPVVLVQSSASFGLAILAEASLSYLGLGTPPTTPSWGRMIYEAQGFLYTELQLALLPGACIAVAVLGFNLLGDGLRELLDPTLREIKR